MENRKIIRAIGAGVFFGEIAEENGNTIVAKNVRRIWEWVGARTLSELAQYGTVNPKGCKITCKVDKIKIFNVVEILDVTEKAAKCIDEVEEWKMTN